MGQERSEDLNPDVREELCLEELLERLDSLLYARQGKHLSHLQRSLLSAAWQTKRQGYGAIAQQYGYSENYLKYDAGPKLWQCLSQLFQEKVRKTNVRPILEHQLMECPHNRSKGLSRPDATVSAVPQQHLSPVPSTIGDTILSLPSPSRVDLGAIPDVESFYGREDALTALGQWIEEEHCRLISLGGMVGVGKTALIAKLIPQIQPSFQVVVWRSLLSPLSLPDLLQELLQAATAQLGLPGNAQRDPMTSLVTLFKQHRCLVVLDGWDSLLTHNGRYHADYASYGNLLHQVATVPHRSCLIITSREHSPESAQWMGSNTARCWQLSGLSAAEAQGMLATYPDLSATEGDWQDLVNRCDGNPLFLRMAITSAQALFDGHIGNLCREETLVFGDLRAILQQQLQRLSDLELAVLDWLAIHYEPVTAAEIKRDLLQVSGSVPLLEALTALIRRSLVETVSSSFATQQTTRFSLKPILREYLIQQLVDQVDAEIRQQSFDKLHSHALIKAQTKEYLRDIQKQSILRPLAQRLQDSFQNDRLLEQHLKQLLVKLQTELAHCNSYAAGNLLNLLCELKFDLRGYDFSNLVVWQADLQGVTLQDVNFSGANLSRSIFTKPLASALSLAFSPDGQRLATSDINGTIRLWQVTDGKQLLTCEGYGSWVCLVAFSPDGQWLASASEDHTVKLWNAHTGKCTQVLSGHRSWVWAIAFNGNGQLLASASEDHSIRIWSLRSGRCLKTLTGHNSWVCAVAFSPKGNLLVSAGDDHLLRLWNARTGECLKNLWGHSSRVSSLVFSPDGGAIASSSEDQTIKLWDVKTGECVQTLRGHQHWVWAADFSPDGTLLVSGSHDQTVKLWDLATGICQKTLQGHSSWVQSVAFSPDGTTIASGSEDQTIRLWDVQTGQCLNTLRGYASWVQSVAFSPDGTLLASSSEDHTARLWDIATGRCIQTLRGPVSALLSVAFSPCGTYLTGGGFDPTLRLWDIATGTCIRQLEGHSSWIRAVAFSPCGNTLASSGGDCQVKLWDVKTGVCTKTLRGHTNWIWSVAFSPDGQYLASCGDDQTIHIWDVETGYCRTILRDQSSSVTSVAFSPDGKYFVSSSADQTIKLWDVSTGECVKTFVGHSSAVFLVTFSPDGRWLASGSADQTIKLWDVSTGECVKTLSGHSNLVFSVAFSPDGQMLASGSRDETIKLWMVAEETCWKTLRMERPYEGMNISAVTGLTDSQITTLVTLGAVVTEFINPVTQ